MKRKNTLVGGNNMDKTWRWEIIEDVQRKSIISISLKGRGRRGRVGDKPGISGAVINCVLISESKDADLCFKNLNLAIICFGVSRKRYKEFS